MSAAPGTPETRPRAAGWRSYLFGPHVPLGVGLALAACAVDQAVKLWLLYVFDLGARGAVPVLPHLDFVLVWNIGISYGLFPQHGPFGQWALLVLKILAVALLWIWMARSATRLTAAGLGLIIGGAFGNAIDRLAHGAVVDFVLFHIRTAEINFNWYVFNMADVAIVAGVALLLYESLIGPRAAKAP